ncbi:MAG: hypothetical protein OHK0057_22290 [Thermoflexibacter sp.]
MLKHLTKLLIYIFDLLEHRWESLRTVVWISNSLVLTFLCMIFLVVLEKFSFIHTHFNYHSIISVPFTILLLFEMVGLVFILPQSVANALGKQIEILSLILLRASFKEFGEIEVPLVWEKSIEQILKMLSDGCGALAVFVLLAYYYSIQRHKPVTASQEEQLRFVNYRKIIALGLLLVFIIIGILDLYHWYRLGVFNQSFNTFYTIMIYADILVVLIAVRYTTRFQDIFRYSAFIFITIIIRLSLVVPVYFNVLLGITACLVAIGVTLCYNYFVNKIQIEKN